MCRLRAPRRARKSLRISGGVERTTWDDVFSAGRTWNRQFRNLVVPLVLVLLVLHVIEIGGRLAATRAAADPAAEEDRAAACPWRRDE